jgi:ADP-ribose pyrophosphatase YjhB (NUDIX family)
MVHYIQLEILKQLLFNPGATFSSLDPKDIGSNLIAYHLKQLIESGLVEKEKETYHLTLHGKEFASMIDTWEQHAVIHKQGKNRVVCFIFQGEIGKSKVVLQTRLKEPFFGNKGFPAEKIQFGEQSVDAAKRCIKRETGLSGELKFRGTCHKIITFNNEILEDSYFFVYSCENAKGDLLKEGDGLTNEWFEPSLYKDLPNIYPGTDKVLENVLTNKDIFWIEDFFEVKRF